MPLVNFLGWLLTVYLYMQIFALYLRNRGPAPSAARTRSAGDLQAVVLYAATTLSFFAAYFKGDRVTVTDATGHTWQTGDIYEPPSCSPCSACSSWRFSLACASPNGLS